MIESRSRPSRAHPVWAGFSSWQDELTFTEDVATPCRLLWGHYKSFCVEWGFEPADAERFMRWLRNMEGVQMKQAGRQSENMLDGVAIQDGERRCT